MKAEPVMTGATVLALVGAVLVLLRSFGVMITDDQYNAIIGVVAIVAPIVVGVIVRRKVSPS